MLLKWIAALVNNAPPKVVKTVFAGITIFCAVMAGIFWKNNPTLAYFFAVDALIWAAITALVMG